MWIAKNIVDLDNSVEKNIQLLCSAKKVFQKKLPLGTKRLVT